VSSVSPLIIGVTGGIGSGKSVMCAVLAALGAPVFNADQVAKQAYAQPGIRQKVQERFGEDVYNRDQFIPGILAERLFGNATALADIATIVHPFVKNAFDSWVNRQKHPYVVREAAILVESGSYRDCYEVVLVTAPDSMRMRRVISRDGVGEKDVANRMKSQWTDQEKMKYAQRVWNNDGKHLLIPEIYDAHLFWCLKGNHLRG
jgi:dephospho-CoA kinase